jgi:PhzF family phenazine biosynthesis protein
MPTVLTIDAFTAEPFRGNPACVCLLETEPPESWMRSVAAEMNLSETAFLLPDDDAWRLRWFTPTTEVQLCGHATLASAHALWETGRLQPEEPARFDTRSGRLTARRDGDWIEMDFPSLPVDAGPLPAEAVAALRLEPVGTHRTRGEGQPNYLVEVASEADVRGCTPDFGALRRVEAGVIVTARSDAEHDFVSRYFAGFYGVDEDPVTGSAHCSLMPFWAERLGRRRLVGFQASARGGLVRCSQKGDRVGLGGQAVTVLRGELLA